MSPVRQSKDLVSALLYLNQPPLALGSLPLVPGHFPMALTLHVRRDVLSSLEAWWYQATGFEARYARGRRSLAL